MSETIDKTFTVSSPAYLNLSNIRGSVEIHPGPEGTIQVTAVKDVHSGDAERTEIELTQDADGTVRVATRFPEAAWGWLFGSFPCRVEYVVHAPRSCFLKIKGVSSEIEADGFEGEFSFETVSGGIELRDLSGPAKIKSVSGEVELTGMNGDLRLNSVSGKVSGRQVRGGLTVETVSGKVSLLESDLSSIDAGTVSGGMVYQTALGSGPYRFHTVSGSVEMQVPADSRCSLELNTVSGKLSSQLPATSVSNQKSNQSAEVQGGGVKVSARSVSGGFSLGA